MANEKTTTETAPPAEGDAPPPGERTYVVETGLYEADDVFGWRPEKVTCRGVVAACQWHGDLWTDQPAPWWRR